MSIVSATRWALREARDEKTRKRLGYGLDFALSEIKSGKGRPVFGLNMLGRQCGLSLKSRKGKQLKVKETAKGFAFDLQNPGTLTIEERDTLAFPDGSLWAPELGLLSVNLIVTAPGEYSWDFELTGFAGCKFAYQGALTQAERDGNASEGPCVRPAWAVGSYAIFDGGLKVGHIARPFARDADGNWTWCTITITNDVATVTAPKAWMDNARLPIEIDPDIGYTSAGATQTAGGQDYVRVFVAGGGLGLATAVKLYCDYNPARAVTLGIYDGVGALKVDTAGGNCGTSAGWVTQNLDSNFTLVNGTLYAVGQDHSTGAMNLYFDADANAPIGTYFYAASAYSAGALPNPVPDFTYGAAQRKFSAYITANDPVFPSAGNVWTGTGSFGPTGADYSPSKRASSITNCSSANVRYGVTIDDVTGGIEMPNSGTPTGTQDATSDACVVSGKKYGSPQRTGSASAGYTYGDSDASKVLTTATGAGTFSVANLANNKILKGVTWGVSLGSTGTLEGIIDSSAVVTTVGCLVSGTRYAHGTVSGAGAYNAVGIVYSSGTYAASGTLTSAGAYNATGILSAAATYNATGILAAAGYAATGIYDGSSKYTSGVWDGTTRNATGILIDATTYHATGVWDGSTYGATGIVATGPAYHAGGILKSDGTYYASSTLTTAMVLGGNTYYDETGSHAGAAYGDASAAKVLQNASAAGTAYGGTTAGTVLTTATVAGTYVQPVTGQVLSSSQGGTAFGPASGTSGTLTLADTQYVLTTAPDYGISGTGGAKTATLPIASNVLTGSGSYGVNGTGSTPSYSPDFPDAGNVLNTDTVNGSSGTLTLPDTSVVLTSTWGGPAAYGVGGTGSTPQATLTAADNVLHGSGQYGKYGSLLTPNYYAPSDQAGVTTATTYGVGNAVSGTLNMSLYTLISGVAAASDVRYGQARFSGGPNGTLTGCVDSSGVNQGTTGILASGTFYSSGILTSGGSYYETGILADAATRYWKGILDASGVYHVSGIADAQTNWWSTGICDGSDRYAWGTFSAAGAYNAQGVIYGVGSYATESSRNSTTASAAQIATGYSITLAGTTTNGSATLEGHTADQVLKSAGGNYNDDNLSVGNVRPVAFGLSQTGTLANLAATDAAYVSLEASRNNDNGTVAADIITGKSVKVRNSTISGSATLESHTADQVISSAGGNWNVANLSAGNIRPVAFGLSQTGTLANLSASDAAYLSLESSRNAKTAGASQILAGYSVTIAGSTTNGTFDESARNTDPGPENVLAGHNYIIAGTAKTASLTLPTAAYVLTSAWGGPSTYGVAGTGSTPSATLTAGSTVYRTASIFGAAGTSITPSADTYSDGVSAGYSTGYTAGEIAGIASQYSLDQSEVLASAEWIVAGHSILGQAGTLDLSAYTLISGIVESKYVLLGTYNYPGGTAGTLTLPSASDVWHTADSYGVPGAETTPTKTASTIDNCIPGNIALGVTIDDVAGEFSGGGSTVIDIFSSDDIFG